MKGLWIPVVILSLALVLVVGLVLFIKNVSKDVTPDGSAKERVEERFEYRAVGKSEVKARAERIELATGRVGYGFETATGPYRFILDCRAGAGTWWKAGWPRVMHQPIRNVQCDRLGDSGEGRDSELENGKEVWFSFEFARVP